VLASFIHYPSGFAIIFGLITPRIAIWRKFERMSIVASTARPEFYLDLFKLVAGFDSGDRVKPGSISKQL
jgi:hypothetical protein